MSTQTTTTRDGAHIRRWRLLDIITYVHDWEGEGSCRPESVQTFMTLKHGLTRQRTLAYIRELEVAFVLATDRYGGLKLRQSYEKVLSYFAGAADPDKTHD